MGDVPGRAFDEGVVEEFRANGGRVGGALAGTTLVLVHAVGAGSGRERVIPLACAPQGGGRFVIAASNGGSPDHPAWYHDLTAHPRITVELGTETFPVLAEELAGAARARVWSGLVAGWPSLGGFQQRTTRRIPLFLLTRLG
jgi:deazaflavin-dependent oxidoreductase (nitroreductase family)